MKTLLIAAALISTSISVAAAPEPVTPTDSGGGVTASAGTAPALAAKPAKPPKPKMVCEETKELGSMIARQVCTTETQRDARRRHDLEELNRLRDLSGAAASGQH
jgi:predicted secreted protein